LRGLPGFFCSVMVEIFDLGLSRKRRGTRSQSRQRGGSPARSRILLLDRFVAGVLVAGSYSSLHEFPSGLLVGSVFLKAHTGFLYYQPRL